MRTRRFYFGLPLLAKELNEQAAHRRTYAMRTLYAGLLFFVASIVFLQQFGLGSSRPFEVLGQGSEIFGYLVWFQFAGIYLFVPPLTCGALTTEKERNSLGLLFLTRLGPWTILFEKLASRLVPMFTILLLSLPVFAFTYSLGGISPEQLWLAVWYLTITVLQVATLALMCSAFFRTTAAALIGCYLLAIAMYVIPPLLQVMEFVDWSSLWAPYLNFYGMRELLSLRQATSMLLFGPTVLLSFSSTLSTPAMLAASIPILSSIALFLGLARYFLVRRAFVQPRNMLVKLFRTLDGVFERINQNKVTQGIVLIEDQAALPGYHPVAWRETTKKSLGTARYLIRVLLVLELPVAVFCLLVTAAGETGLLELIAAVVFLFWIIALLIVTVSSTNLIAGERGRGTFDVLRVTPLRGWEVIEQKLRGVRRLMIVVSVPLITLIVLQAAWWSGTLSYSNYTSRAYRAHLSPGDLFLFCVVSLLMIVTYLRLACWLSFWIGLKVRSQTRAVIGSMVVVALWTLSPLIWMVPFVAVWNVATSPAVSEVTRAPVLACYLMSPACLLWVNEFASWRSMEIEWPWLVIVVHFAIQWQLLRSLRTRCLDSADRLLERE